MYASTESDREYARNAGAECPEQAWILANSDAWYPNPCYRGPAVPHPEDDSAYQWADEMIEAQDMIEIGGPVFNYFTAPGAWWLNEIPF